MARVKNLKSNGGPQPPAVKIGRPSKYKPEFDDLVYRLCLLGYDDAECAKFFEIDEANLKRWDKAYPSFRASRVRGRELADMEVIASLHERAKGFVQKQQKVVTEGQGGGVSKAVVVEYEETVAGDTKAQELWLMNRQPAKWRPRNNDANAGDKGTTIIIQGGLPDDEEPKE